MSTFKEFSNSFITHFINGQMHKRSTHALMQIRQWEDESLRSYVARFNKEALLIDEADEMVLVTTFSSKLKEGEFLFSMLKNETKTMAEDTQPDTKEKTSRYKGKRDDREVRPSSGQIINFTPLNTRLDQVLMRLVTTPHLIGQKS